MTDCSSDRPRAQVASKAEAASNARPRVTARSLALTILERIEKDHCHADEAISSACVGVALDPRDRALLMELVYGVLRHRLRLDWRLDHVASQRMGRVPSILANALRLGAYQLLYLTKVPHAAAVHETVTLIRGRVRGPRWPGFANAVLRALLRNPPPDLVPITSDVVQHLSIWYSCPSWLVERWAARLGVAGAEQVCRQTTEEPPLTLRVNTARTTREALMERFRGAGFVAAATRMSPVGVHVDKSGSPAKLPGYVEGLFYVEDEAAQLIPFLLGATQGDRVLDACAAPGGKTMQLDELMGGGGDLVAVDRGVDRLRVMRSNMARLGSTEIKTVALDWLKADVSLPTSLPPPLRESFDRILLDAPCSGLGILRRHPEGKWQKQTVQLADHHRRQVRLLDTVARLLRPGGVIVYSTCSTEPEETLQVIDDFCEAHSDFSPESVAPWLPPPALPLVTDRGEFCSLCHRAGEGQDDGAGHSMDAFYAARLKRAPV